MFHLSEKNQARGAGNRFYLAPALGKVLESAPLERVNFIRDEMANMVWGVESIVPSQTGQGISGYETEARNEPVGPRNTDNENVKIGYVLGTTVPKNWIPFIAVHAEGSVSEIRLQRAAWLEATLRVVSCCASRVHPTSSKNKKFRAPEFSWSVRGNGRAGLMAAPLSGLAGGKRPAEAKVGVSWCSIRSWIYKPRRMSKFYLRWRDWQTA